MVYRRVAPEQVVLEVEAPPAAWVVLSESWFPGWRARVRAASGAVSKPAIEPAYGILQAFRLPDEPGPYTVEVAYASTWLGTGVWLSAGVGSLLLFGVLASWRARAHRLAR